MKYLLIALVALPTLFAGWVVVQSRITNPRIALELRESPDGARARKVMLLTLPSGRTIPVNYLREGDKVFAGADGRWWRELRGAGQPVEVLVRGETLRGRGRAVEDDPEYRAAVFRRLRPSAPRWAGTLVEITLATATLRD